MNSAYYFLFALSNSEFDIREFNISVSEIAQAMVTLIHQTRLPITNCLSEAGIIMA